METSRRKEKRLERTWKQLQRTTTFRAKATSKPYFKQNSASRRTLRDHRRLAIFSYTPFGQSVKLSGRWRTLKTLYSNFEYVTFELENVTSELWKAISELKSVLNSRPRSWTNETTKKWTDRVELTTKTSHCKGRAFSSKRQTNNSSCMCAYEVPKDNVKLTIFTVYSSASKVSSFGALKGRTILDFSTSILLQISKKKLNVDSFETLKDFKNVSQNGCGESLIAPKFWKGGTLLLLNGFSEALDAFKMKH